MVQASTVAGPEREGCMSGKAFVMDVERYGVEAGRVREVICRPAVAMAHDCQPQADLEIDGFEQDNDLLGQLLAAGAIQRVR